jgi:hypothetical protein
MSNRAELHQRAVWQTLAVATHNDVILPADFVNLHSISVV